MEAQFTLPGNSYNIIIILYTVYRYHRLEHKNCSICSDIYYYHIFFQMLGFLATLSSEASVLILLTITCDRLKNIVSPFGGWKLTIRSAHSVMVLVWSVALLIAVIPLIPGDYFQGEFYSR